MDKPVNLFNTQLDKASDFRYFALLGAFLFFLDYMLILKLGIPLSELKYSMLKNEINIGEIFIFFCLFAFFLSFLVPLIRRTLRLITRLIPFSWIYFFHHDEWKGIKPTDCFYDYQLKAFAIKTNNTTAYQHYNTITQSQLNTDKSYHFSLAYLTATLFNLYAYMMNDGALFSAFVIFFDENKNSPIDAVYALPFYALYIFCFYFGVIRGGGFSLRPDNKYFLWEHGFKE